MIQGGELVNWVNRWHQKHYEKDEQRRVIRGIFEEVAARRKHGTRLAIELLPFSAPQKWAFRTYCHQQTHKSGGLDT